MKRIGLVFGVALVASLLLVPLMRRLALKIGLIDAPGDRKAHRAPTPLLGGAAIYVAAMLSLLAIDRRYQSPRLPTILAGATLMFVLGLIDDRRGLGPRGKLGGQFLATGGLILAGVHTHLFAWFPLDVAVTVLWMVGMTNAFNFLDNMDGLAAGLAAIAGIFFVLWGLDNGQRHLAALAAAVAGGSLGFLVYNFNPARIFMGDAGSLFLGFSLAALALDLRFPTRVQTLHWMIPILALGLPIFDTVLVTISRVRRGVPVYVGGRDHVSHRLVRGAGFSVRGAVLSLYLLAACLAAVAFFLTRARFAYGFAVLGGLGAVAVLGIVKLEALLTRAIRAAHAAQTAQAAQDAAALPEARVAPPGAGTP